MKRTETAREKENKRKEKKRMWLLWETSFMRQCWTCTQRYLTGNVGKINAGDDQKIGAEKAAATVTQGCACLWSLAKTDSFGAPVWHLAEAVLACTSWTCSQSNLSYCQWEPEKTINGLLLFVVSLSDEMLNPFASRWPTNSFLVLPFLEQKLSK